MKTQSYFKTALASVLASAALRAVLVAGGARNMGGFIGCRNRVARAMSDHRLGGALALAAIAGVLVPFIAGIGTAAATVIVDRAVFYNNSSFDGFNPAINAADDGAIATDKTALLTGQTATFANYTSYDLGINGLMVDFSGGVGAVTAADFIFRVGDTADPSTWTPAPATSAVAVRAIGGGVNRVELTWADGAIVDTWLQATVLATVATGIASPDVFYFGNLIGETGGDFAVTAADIADIGANAGSAVFIENVYDINRDGNVDTTDSGIANKNISHTLSQFEAPMPGSGSQKIPEPDTLALFAVGLAGLVFMRRRRVKA